MNIQFGDYKLDETNNLYNTGWRELHGAEKEFSILKPISLRGVKVVKVMSRSKIIEWTGEMICDDSGALSSAIQAFLKNMMLEGQPLIKDGMVYDGVFVNNPEELVAMRDYEYGRFVSIRILFLCPTGFARSIAQTTQVITNITEIPYIGNISINGNTEPLPVITINVVTATTLSELNFANLTTNQSISVTDLTLADGDIISFDTDKKIVLHNATEIVFDGEFPEFVIGNNSYQLTGAGDNAVIIGQTAYNDEKLIYGSTQIAQSFQVAANDISQIGLMLKRIENPAVSLYDDFSGSLSKWSTSGHVAIVDGQVVLGSFGGSGDQGPTIIISNGSYFSQGVVVNWHRGNVGSPGATKPLIELTTTDRSKRITITHTGGNDITINAVGYGGGSVSTTIAGGLTIDIRQQGSDIVVKINGSIYMTCTGQTLDANSRLAARTYGESGSGVSNENQSFDDVYQITTANTNSDLTVDITVNSSGHPGSPVTHGTIVIPAGSVSTDTFSEIIKPFLPAPSLSGATTYHVKISQSGGDLNNYYLIKTNNYSNLSSGNLEISTDGGSTWTQLTDQDAYLRLWSAFPVGFVLGIIITYFPSYLNIG